MIKVNIIASGSKGNCCLVRNENTNILIDIGVSFKRLKEELDLNKIELNEVEALLITHEHIDHIKGLRVLLNKHKLKLYVPSKLTEYFKEYIDSQYIVSIEKNFLINDFTIKSIKTSHDSIDSSGYLIKDKDHSIVYITDTGYINQKYLDKLYNHQLYIIESNHDEEMLMNGPYPYHLKQRVLSDKGHLSNYASANYLKKIIGTKTTHIVLAHLSEKNNTEEIAHQTVIKTLSKEQLLNKKIIIAKQEESEIIELV